MLTAISGLQGMLLMEKYNFILVHVNQNIKKEYGVLSSKFHHFSLNNYYAYEHPLPPPPPNARVTSYEQANE